MLRSAASPGSRGVRPARERWEWPPQKHRFRPATFLRGNFFNLKIGVVRATVSRCRSWAAARDAYGCQTADTPSPRRPQIKPGIPDEQTLDPSKVANDADRGSKRHLILVSRNSTCFLATGSYFFLLSLSVMVREFFLVT